MSEKSLPSRYDPAQVEDKCYRFWIENDLFRPRPGNRAGKTFTIMIPPPNITGTLTMGHVLNNTIQDILIRYRRMQGWETLWLPGTDHASIATETKLTRILQEKKIDKRELGRDNFLKQAWEWKNKYGRIIITQLKKLGCSCDWSRERFTMDEGYSRAVLEAFVRLYRDGLIYRGEKIINWDPVGRTALSDEEVIYKETKGYLWYFKYPVKDSNEYVVVATTRPETMLGDTGVAVNPKDERYRHLIGKAVILPIVNREIPLFADDFVDPKFGTGCVKVTPAHDPNDFEMGQRHGLETINILNPDASLNENVPQRYRNLDRFEARKAVVKELQQLGLVEKVEDYTYNIGHSERTDAVVEPYISKQWFLNMKPMAKLALEAVADGRIKFYPERWVKTYNHWLENVHDWCISRQLWWGHRIPVWYRGEEVYCGLKPPQGEGWKQDEDVLDTWFSSWLWPFATLGWPEKTDDLKKFYPTQVLVTGPDIIFFWVARMIMAGRYFLNEIPFSNVYFTGIIRDHQGRKMSKSLGNSPDPLDVIARKGADALRMGIMLITPKGQDILYSEDRIDIGRNFANKIWNASRFTLMNLGDISKHGPTISDVPLAPEDRWILSRLNKTVSLVTRSLDEYEFSHASSALYQFIWSEFCDWYIELCKLRLYDDENPKQREVARTVLRHTLSLILRLLHPFMPFITETIYQKLNPEEKSIMVAQWPESNPELIDETAENKMNILIDIITTIRNLRGENQIAPKEKRDVYLVFQHDGHEDIFDFVDKNRRFIDFLARSKKVHLSRKGDVPRPCAGTLIREYIFIALPLTEEEVFREKQRIQKELGNIEEERAKRIKKLNNLAFREKAPPEVVEKVQSEKAEYDKREKKLREILKHIEK